MSGKVRTERSQASWWSSLKSAINAGSLVVREGLLRAIDTLNGDESLEAAVIIGGGTTFIAGSDLPESGKPLDEPQLPAVIAAIESCPKPVVAALHGAALGRAGRVYINECICRQLWDRHFTGEACVVNL